MELKEVNGMRRYIFPSYIRSKEPMSKGTILVALKRMGYSRKMTGHGFRALAMGVLKESLGYQHDVVDRQLAHVPKSSVDRAYDRAQFLSQRFEMMQRFADYLDELHLKFMADKINRRPSISGSERLAET
jgi:integrase